MIIDDNATTSSSFSVHHGVLKIEHPVEATPARPRGRMRRRHSVDFNPTPQPEMKEVERLDEKSRAKCWYSREEYNIIKARNSLIVKMTKTGHFRESDEHSFRGLEHKLKQGFKQRRANKFNALNAVLEEQDRQISKGVIEPEKIARQYRRVSLNAAETAMFVGARDAAQSLSFHPPPPSSTSPAVDVVEMTPTNDNVVEMTPADDNVSEMTPSVQCDDIYGYNTDADTIASEDSAFVSPEDEQQKEIARLEVRGLFAAASLMKRSGGRMNRRTSM
mmetsp:Transcript_19560/g.25234  ORF Transcript_19560/g.25234 Transcript_19560/m.25234 type:complete len:276 (+) Transcript_19560:80-907(+)|eukprot:CAMPEP_0198156194 /NCGR_PEP_ID=MMETSP1443-20131203/69529_1 /TAXON_ID=186043 /ORGANISM="Entomoneis sp., Strain CCMP2396" /LENGTH=275 /DNA_ID=CAMNT_0043822977 /DNA_START=28 /DNA_END=855 /DNA_ORIENTATION=+